MRIIITLLFIFSVNAAHADEKIFFSQIPANISTEQAIGAVKAAALRKRWSVQEMEDGILPITLDHRGYKAVLKFYFSTRNIHYSDHTTFYNETFEEDVFGDQAAGEWEKSTAPARWVNNLKNELYANFNRIPAAEPSSSEDVEKKLETLKNLYDKKLITEAEYLQKKKDIMSNY